MDLLTHAPHLDPGSAALLAQNFYGVSASATTLPSERDQNFLLTTDSGKKFVLKIANSLEERVLLEAQNAVMSHLQRLSFCPQPVPTMSGELLAQISPRNGARAIDRHFVRLLTYVPGVPLGVKKKPSPALLFDLGKKLARVDQALADFDHEAFHRNFHWDLQHGPEIIRRYSPLIEDRGLQAAVIRYLEKFEQTTSHLLPKLRRSIIHNDANDYNIIVSDLQDDQVTGLIDFGDMVYSYTVGELAVAIAYVILDKTDPIGTATDVAAGYSTEYKLTRDEIDTLFGLAILRLCMSVCLAAHQQQQEPRNAYLAISQGAIANILPRLVTTDLRGVAAAFHEACNSD